jgi:hypothetical protein
MERSSASVDSGIFGAVPAVARWGGGGSILNWVPIRPAVATMFQRMDVFTEFEPAMIVERVKAGLARARSQGKRLGRRPVTEDVVERIRGQLATGTGILKTAKALGQGAWTRHRNRSSGETRDGHDSTLTGAKKRPPPDPRNRFDTPVHRLLAG